MAELKFNLTDSYQCGRALRVLALSGGGIERISLIRIFANSTCTYFFSSLITLQNSILDEI